jgi:cytoskeletal protein RodZ
MFEIGNTLREARLRRALDIADCEAATKIRAKYLRALEEEQFEMLPGVTYVKGFLRTYAEFLDLDGRLVLDEYESRYTNRSDHPYHPDGDPNKRRAKRRRSREGRVLLVASTLVMLTSTGLWVGFADQKAPAVAPQVTPVTVAFKAVGAKPTYLEVHQDSPDGKAFFTPGELAAGGTRILDEVRPPLWVYVGDGPGVTLTIDGRAVQTPAGSAKFTILAGGTILPATTP